MNYSISDTAELRRVCLRTPRAALRGNQEEHEGCPAGHPGRHLRRKVDRREQNGRTFFNSKRAQLAKHQMEIVGEELRKNMIWGGDKDLDTASN